MLAISLGVLGGSLERPARAQAAVSLAAGCTNVALAEAAGTPLRDVAARISPAEALLGIFVYVGDGRFRAFSPSAPDAVNDYRTVTAPFEPVFICMHEPGTYHPWIEALPPATVAPPIPPVMVPRGVLLAPALVRRGETAEVQLGTLPGYVCAGGVNVPSGGTFRFIPVAVAAAPSGLAVIRFNVLPSDTPGFGLLSVRCADGQFLRVEFRVA
ncbi:MAG: hypothetical protein C4290_05290 [Chloroflexota bacterium]